MLAQVRFQAMSRSRSRDRQLDSGVARRRGSASATAHTCTRGARSGILVGGQLYTTTVLGRRDHVLLCTCQEFAILLALLGVMIDSILEGVAEGCHGCWRQLVGRVSNPLGVDHVTQGSQ